jgi:hypothetical protein
MLPREPVIDGDLDDWPPGPRIHLDTAGQYVSGSGGAWGGPADLSAVVRLGWRPAGLCVGVEVRDNIYDQPYTDANIWQADSVQLALAPDRQQTTASVAHFEIGLARTSAGDHVYTYSSLADTTTQDANPVLFASRRGENGNLAYETLIPWALLPGIRPAEGGALRFSLVVNDSDGAGRRGWMEAFSGIGLSKDPSLYGRMVLAGGL